MTTPADIAYRNYLATTPDRNESAAGYAMWNAAVEACAKMMEASVIGLEVHTFNFAGHAKFITTLAVSDLIRARAAAIRSLMTSKTEQEVMQTEPDPRSGNYAMQPQPTVANDTAGAEQIEAAAAALGLELGPPDSQSGGWTISYRPNVRWPQDYSERERIKLRNAATVALEAVRRLTQPQNATLCTFGPPAERKRLWILKFEDADHCDMFFDNEAEAFAKFDRCKDAWTCTLFVTAQNAAAGEDGK